MNQDIYRVNVGTSKMAPPPNPPVTVIDFDMPFLSMVNFMVKWMFASLLAATAIGFVLFIIIVLLVGLAWMLVP